MSTADHTPPIALLASQESIDAQLRRPPRPPLSSSPARRAASLLPCTPAAWQDPRFSNVMQNQPIILGAHFFCARFARTERSSCPRGARETRRLERHTSKSHQKPRRFLAGKPSTAAFHAQIRAPVLQNPAEPQSEPACMAPPEARVKPWPAFLKTPRHSGRFVLPPCAG